MKTYNDLVQYAAEELNYVSKNYSQEIKSTLDLEDRYYDVHLLPKDIPDIKVKAVVDTVINEGTRYYTILLLYFKEEVFAMYSSGGRSISDYECVKVFNHLLWRDACLYAINALSYKVYNELAEEECNTSLDEDIRPEYGDIYPQEFIITTDNK